MKKRAMNSMKGCFIRSVVFVVVWLLAAVTARADLVIVEPQTADVTPSGFAVIWKVADSAFPQTGVAATPRIAVFSDMAATVEITSELEVTPIPLYGGDPGAIDEYHRETGIEDLRDLAQDMGIMKIGVHGCLPQTTYYYRIFSDNGADTVQWPESGVASVTTTQENAFVIDSKQVLVTLVDDSGTLAPQGWLVTASTSDAIYPISSYVGDGCGANQAFLNLSNLFDADEDNWTPTGVKIVTLQVRSSDAEPVQRGLSLFYAGDFHISAVTPVEINMDASGDTDPPGVQADPPGGLYNAAQSVTLASDETAYIFYTTDGSNPTTDSNLYTDPIQVDTTTTLKVFAVDLSGNQSAVETILYTIVYNRPPFEPSAPEPADGATGVSIETMLRWQGGDPDPTDTVAYDVSLGTSDVNMSDVCSDQATGSCAPGTLDFGTTYSWQVVAKDDHSGQTAGPVWHFTTFAYDGDEDGDGLINEEELSYGTDPHAWDTDKDGFSDFEEVGIGSDPLDRTSIPPYPPGFGDLDGDQDIDGADLAMLVSAFGSGAGDEHYLAVADFNADGVSDQVDLEMFSRVFGYAFYPEYDPAADFDGDGDVDGADLSRLVAAFGSVEAVPESGYDVDVDLNKDGRVDRWDLALFSTGYGCLAP
ncbi:MAG: chitobiase/beta-hexosaminidase C-terminal domain-containing protein [Deltaproteobacteria bacterium]|nr:chitobiase/beta-hexosaminidase C-terminal domain-containing protein [Deltaproteobacteria bacterium]